MFKFLYYGISLVACFPIIIWNAFVAVIMFDSKYWDDCMALVANMLQIVDDHPVKF